MSFTIDKQTFDDLHIFGRHGDSIFNLFNTTYTRGGAQLLEEMFLYPLADIDKINRRSDLISYFMEKGTVFPFRIEAFDAIEHYLDNTDERTRIAEEDDTLQRRLRNYMGADTAFDLLHNGIVASIELFNDLHDFLQKTATEHAPPAFTTAAGEMQTLLSDSQLVWMYGEKGNKKLPYARAARFDQVLRFQERNKIKALLQHIYMMDVFISAARVAASRDFAFARAIAAENNTLRIDEMYHPCLPHAVANSLTVDRHSNVIFLTGANMAGKSTFMKTLGVTVFLAHIGFPVPARQMEFTVQNGLFTTINMADNLNLGYSHFYAEVLRLKKVALRVTAAGNLLVIFDELFRGTNVKDAYDATVAVTDAFAGRPNCIFIISTHIIEAGEALRERRENINFLYFPTHMKDNTPEYTYRLTPGITNDRHGMMIINNENIIGILKGRRMLKSV